jgi:hypothetical protein
MTKPIDVTVMKPLADCVQIFTTILAPWEEIG